MAIKKKAHEKLDDTTIKRVMVELESKNPITKKEACGMLNISYNTTRLAKIIKNYEKNKIFSKKRFFSCRKSIIWENIFREVGKSY